MGLFYLYRSLCRPTQPISLCVINMLSTPDTSVNALMEDAAFKLNQVTMHGSYMTEISMAMRSNVGRFFNLTISASITGDAYPISLNGTCDGKDVSASSAKYFLQRACDDVGFSAEHNAVTVTTHEWAIKVQGRPIFDRLSGPSRRVDLTMEPRVAEDKMTALPHGLVGQSFDRSGIPRVGRTDLYPPLSVPGEFETKAMAEGAIAGVADDYIVDSKFATAFKYSVFN